MITNRFNYLLNNKRHLEDKRYPLAEAARLAHVSRQSVHYWYTGAITQYDRQTLYRLCLWLGCEIGDLLQMP